MPKKYVVIDGMLQVERKESHSSREPSRAHALPIITSPQELMEASAVRQAATGQGVKVSSTTGKSLQHMQRESFEAKFPKKKDGKKALENISAIFTQYEIPLGLLSLLLELSKYNLNFIIDNSTSMSWDSDVLTSDATPYMQEKIRKQHASTNKPYLTRIQEAEDRLHTLIDIFACLPIKNMHFSFLNGTNALELNRGKMSTKKFAKKAHQQISELFTKTELQHGTPIHGALVRAFAQPDPTANYLLTDGAPTDARGAPTEAAKKDVEKLVISRPDPINKPLTFLSCTNDNDEAGWMKVLEGKPEAEYVSETDDRNSETKEVAKKQGPGFPYSKGLWLMMQIAAALDPKGLDAIDDGVVFTRNQLSQLLGYEIDEEQYRVQYFDQHPFVKQYPVYQSVFSLFAQSDLPSQEIIDINREHCLLIQQPAPVQTFPQPAPEWQQPPVYAQQPQTAYPPQYYPPATAAAAAAAYPYSAPQPYNPYTPPTYPAFPLQQQGPAYSQQRMWGAPPPGQPQQPTADQSYAPANPSQQFVPR